jgi:hypothetical protein
MKIRPVGAELFHADSRAEKRGKDGRVDRHNEATSSFTQFCERA